MADYWTEKYKFIHRLEGVVNGINQDLSKALEGALENVEGKIISLMAKAEETESLVRKRKYLEKQKFEIQKVLKEVYKEIGDDIKAKSIETAKVVPGLVKDAVTKGFSLNFNLGTPNLSKKRIESWFRSSQVEGLFFNDWMKKLEQSTVDRIIKETRLSMLSGESYADAGKRIQKALDIGRKSARAMAQNAVFGAYNWAEREFYFENENRIRGLQFVAELDRKTTPLCASLDSQVFNIKDAPQPPLHWRCRSTLIAIWNDDRFNKIYDEGSRISRKETQGRWINHRDGTRSKTYEKLTSEKISNKMSYRDWMQSLVDSKNPADNLFAKEALGPTRFNLVKSRKLKIDSLYYHGKLRSIKEIKELMK